MKSWRRETDHRALWLAHLVDGTESAGGPLPIRSSKQDMKTPGSPPAVFVVGPFESIVSKGPMSFCNFFLNFFCTNLLACIFFHCRLYFIYLYLRLCCPKMWVVNDQFDPGQVVMLLVVLYTLSMYTDEFLSRNSLPR
jgi:hypothetical protein